MITNERVPTSITTKYDHGVTTKNETKSKCFTARKFKSCEIAGCNRARILPAPSISAGSKCGSKMMSNIHCTMPAISSRNTGESNKLTHASAWPARKSFSHCFRAASLLLALVTVSTELVGMKRAGRAPRQNNKSVCAAAQDRLLCHNAPFQVGDASFV